MRFGDNTLIAANSLNGSGGCAGRRPKSTPSRRAVLACSPRLAISTFVILRREVGAHGGLRSLIATAKKPDAPHSALCCLVAASLMTRCSKIRLLHSACSTGTWLLQPSVWLPPRLGVLWFERHDYYFAPFWPGLL